MIPIICERDPKSRIKDIDKSKYLFPGDLAISNFSLMIRKRLQLPYESALFLFVNGRNAITGDVPLSDVYEWYKDPEDGFLYIYMVYMVLKCAKILRYNYLCGIRWWYWVMLLYIIVVKIKVSVTLNN